MNARPPAGAGFLSQVVSVLRKELVDAVRDRRSLLSALLYPLFGPLLIAAMFSALARMESSERPLDIPIAGVDEAPGLVQFLEEAGVNILEPPADPLAAVRAGDVDLVLIVDEKYGEDLEAARPATVEMVFDSARTSSRSIISRTRDLLREYGGRLGSLRLMARGIDPRVVRGLDLDELDLATPARTAARFFSMLPMFLVLAAFIAGLNVAIDTTAGERERLSLEPLLVTPVRREALVVGKWLATSIFSLVGVLLTLPVFLQAMRFVPLADLGVQLSLGGRELALMVVAVAPMALLASAMQMTVATFARSFKEAQTYVSLLTFLPMVPGFISSIRPITTESWMYLVPALSQQVMLMDVMGGERTSAWNLLLAAGVTAGLAAALVIVTAQLLRRERIVFGR